MILRSLRLRLLGAAAVAIFAALALAWVLMIWLFERHIERRVAGELERAAVQLVAGLQLDAAGQPVAGSAAANTGPADPRFDKPASGLYWQLSSSAGSARSRSLWDETLSAASAPETGWHTRYAAGPFDQRVLLLERTVRPTRSGPPVLVQLAHDEQPLRAASDEFGRELALFLVVLWSVLCAAAWLQVQLGLRPLARVRDELAALQRNPAARLGAAHPREIEPLTSAINDLASAREHDLARARRRAADLAHSLKTPLAALAAQSRRARADGATAAADGLDRAIDAVGAAVEAELARARSAAIRQTRGRATTAPLDAAERIVGVIERTEIGARLMFDIDIDAGLRVPIAAEDLLELLGALVENAARFARRRVRIAAAPTAQDIALTVEDDGEGLHISAEQALLRGGRLDEAGPGHHGLGLAIARDLAQASGGAIALDRSPLGGLCVTLRWQLDADTTT